MCRNGAQKLLGVLITIGEAVAYVVSGMYGDVRELGAGNAILIILQVVQHCLVELDSLSKRAKVEFSLFGHCITVSAAGPYVEAHRIPEH